MIQTQDVYPAGSAPTVWVPGQLLAVRNLAAWYTKNGILDAAIRLGQRLKARHVPKAQRAAWVEACWASHIACVVASDGTLVEMLAQGAEITNADKYAAVDYVVISPFPAGSVDADKAVAYWCWLADTHVGYGYWTLPADALSMAFGLNVGLSMGGRPVCSAAAAAGIGLDQWRAAPCAVSPADVTYTYKAAPPT